MVRPFEDYTENQIAEVEFTLNVKCTEGRSLDVTDLDLLPDASHTVVPVTQALMKQQGGSVKPGGFGKVVRAAATAQQQQRRLYRVHALCARTL
jgi:hypothetical protein